MRYFLSLCLGMMLVLAGCTGQNPPPGNVPPSTDGCICTAIYKPVCGVDGKTYSNDCVARCAKVSVAYVGECGAPNCTDSDGGKNIYQKGTAASGTATATDSCINSSDISEAFCEGAAPNAEIAGCPSTHECKDGACVEKASVPPVPPVPPGPATCQDGDSGQEFHVAASTSKGTLTYNDECTGLQTVKEYYCQDNLIQNIIHQCDPGERCDLGKCVEAPLSCKDTDSGNDIYNKGTVTQGSIVSTHVRTDECVDSDTVREYFCVSDDYESEVRDCPPDHVCENGECREADCEDSDGGSDTSVKGTVTKGEETFNDSCVNGSTVKEYTCDGKDVESQSISCGGMSCTDGKCVP